MTTSTEAAINVVARQLLFDAMQVQHEEVADGYDRIGTLAGIPDAYKERVVKEARDIAANLGPSAATLEAAEHLLTRATVAIPTPVLTGQTLDQTDTPEA